MMITDVLSEDDISLDLMTKEKRPALSKVVSRIAKRSRIDHEPLLTGLLHREWLGSTGVGHGVAIPHALLDVISSPVASFTRLAKPIEFGSPDDDPVDLIFTLLWPRLDGRSFLRTRSCMSTAPVGLDQSQLRNAQSADEVMAILSTGEADRPGYARRLPLAQWITAMPERLSLTGALIVSIELACVFGRSRTG